MERQQRCDCSVKLPRSRANEFCQSKHHGRRIHVRQPNAICEYNKNMGRVDRTDQNVRCYRIHIRSKKRWCWVFAYLFDVSLQNAWLLHRWTAAVASQPLTLLQFRRQVRHTANKVLRGRGEHAQHVDRRVPNEIRYDRIDHLIMEGTKCSCAADECTGRTQYRCNRRRHGTDRWRKTWLAWCYPGCGPRLGGVEKKGKADPYEIGKRPSRWTYCSQVASGLSIICRTCCALSVGLIVSSAYVWCL